jgi:hypothetical protein
VRIVRLVRTFFRTSGLPNARQALANLQNGPPQSVIGNERWLLWDGGSRVDTVVPDQAPERQALTQTSRGQG